MCVQEFKRNLANECDSLKKAKLMCRGNPVSVGQQK